MAFYKMSLSKLYIFTVEKLGGIFQPSYHQTFQVPKMEVLTHISCMDTADVRETPPPKWPYKVQETLHLEVPETFGDLSWNRKFFF